MRLHGSFSPAPRPGPPSSSFAGAGRHASVEIGYADGSAIALDPGSLRQERLLALGREALAAARG